MMEILCMLLISPNFPPICASTRFNPISRMRFEPCAVDQEIVKTQLTAGFSGAQELALAGLLVRQGDVITARGTGGRTTAS
jgi:hypothetical protein